MIDIKDIVSAAEKYALREIELYGTPKTEHFNLSNKVGQKLAKRLKADKDIVMLGTILMDLKLGECFKEGKLGEHIKRSSDAAKEFLRQYSLEDGFVDKVINCIESHHGSQYICPEAEICANADCYRFLHPRGIFSAFVLWGSRDQSLDRVIAEVEKKIEEKHRILSLDICKKELESNYKKIVKLFEKAKLSK